MAVHGHLDVMHWPIVVALAGLFAAPALSAATVVQGSVIRLESVQDAEAMASMTPGETVAWDVGVSTSRDDGMLAITLESSSVEETFSIAVLACATVPVDDACSTGWTTLVEGATAGGALAIADQPASDATWYRVEVSLVEDVEAASAELVFRAAGEGDDVASGGEVGLPETGADPTGALWLAIGAIGVGLLLAGVARTVGRRS